LTAAACVHEPVPPPTPAREALLDQAFSLVDSNPGEAARLFADAGEGPALETARVESWADCLERTSAASGDWREYLAAAPPPTSAARARLQLITALIAEGDVAGASAERSLLHDDRGTAADELLLAAGDENIRLAAAQRLVVAAPRRLSALDNGLDRRLLAALGPEDRLERSRSWRRENAPARAAAELRSLRWRGAEEVERRRELARAELDAGAPNRALRVLPDGSDAGSVDLTLRAQAFRNRAWAMWPDAGAQRVFDDCRTAADRALSIGAAGETRSTALVLHLECATESGRLDAAFDSWRRLEATSWTDPRREWLGRRLGVALAIRGGHPDRVLDIARGLPDQARCLAYWAASSASPAVAPDLDALAAAPVPDLYGRWSLDTLGRAGSTASPVAPAVVPGGPPASVQRLLDSGAEKEAAREWRRIRRARPPTPDEALAGANLAADVGQLNDSITWLRAGFPELGTTDMTRAPENAVEAYLPLRWRSALMTAAAEFGVDPWLLAGIARQESTFTAHAVSPRGATGVMQLLPSTASPHARALGLAGAPDLRDAELNLRLGAREFAHLLQRFGAVEPALAAYNGGETRVRGWWKRQSDPRRFTEDIPIPETYTYVRRVVFLSEAYRQVWDNPRRSPP
jgi:soluble lytic murein transglycosylase